METTPSFDLNEAIRRWREELAASPAVRVEDLDEMESHLRDVAAKLHATGLSLEETYLIGQRRLGSSWALRREFEKVNAGLLWTHRVLWLLTGAITMVWLFGWASLISNVSTFSLQLLSKNLRWNLDESVFGIIGVVMQILAVSGAIGLVWLLAKRGGQIWRKLGSWCRDHPHEAVVWGWLALLGNYLLQFGVSAWYLYANSQGAHSPLFSRQILWGLLQVMIWPTALGYIFLRASRRAAVA